MIRAVRSRSPVVTTLSPEAPPVARRLQDRAWVAGLRGVRAPLLGILAVALPVGVAVVMAVARHPTLVLGGDFAFVEQSVVDAEHGRQLLGSVDRFGVAHLGPAHYYLLAPVYWLLGNRSYGLAVGSLVLVGLASAAVVAVAARRGGLALALVAALLLLLYLHAIGDERLRDPWGPWAIMVPAVLFMVLAAAYAAGSTPALLGALLAGSFIAQTHISTPPTLAAVILVAWLVRHLGGRGTAWPQPRDRGRRPLLLAGLGGLLALAWLPPLIQQVTVHPGNLTLLYRFLRHPHGGFDGTGFPDTIQPAGQDLPHAVSGLGLEFSVFPVGRPAALLAEVSTPGVFPDRGRLLLVLLYAVLAAALVVLARRRGDRFALTLGAAALTAMATAVLSFTHVAGPFFDYLIAWTTALPVVVLLGWAALLAGRLREPVTPAARRVAPLLVTVLAVVVAAASGAETAALAGLPSMEAVATPQGADPALAPAAELVRTDLAAGPGRAALLRVVDPETWPVVAAVGNQLLRHHQPVAVAGAWLYMFGDAYRPTGAERVEYAFVAAEHEAALAPRLGGQRLGQSGDVVVYRRTPSG
jgi:hypothetical protein